MDIINEILVKDKFQNINMVKDILEKEITCVLKNYLIISDDAVIRYRRENNNYIFNVEVVASEIKSMGGHY